MASIGDVLLRTQGNADDIIGTSIWTYAVGVAIRDAVFVSAADTVDQATATGDSEKPSIGVVVSLDDPSPGQCIVRSQGFVTGFVGLTAGKTYILSRVAGEIIASDAGPGDPDYPQNPGEFKQSIGVARSATVLMVLVDPTTFEI